MDDLRKAWGEHNLDRRMQVCFAFRVLIVGEFGIWPYDRESAMAFFTLVSAPYECGSMNITSNKGSRRVGRTAGRERDRVCRAEPAAVPQRHAEHQWEDLSAQGEHGKPGYLPPTTANPIPGPEALKDFQVTASAGMAGTCWRLTA